MFIPFPPCLDFSLAAWFLEILAPETMLKAHHLPPVLLTIRGSSVSSDAVAHSHCNRLTQRNNYTSTLEVYNEKTKIKLRQLHGGGRWEKQRFRESVKLFLGDPRPVTLLFCSFCHISRCSLILDFFWHPISYPWSK